jgi:hypothetical protein
VFSARIFRYCRPQATDFAVPLPPISSGRHDVFVAFFVAKVLGPVDH